MFPFMEKIFGHPENMFVNRRNFVQDEFGIEWIEIDASDNDGLEVYEVEVIQKHAVLTNVWINYFIW